LPVCVGKERKKKSRIGGRVCYNCILGQITAT
jgi:hypothetical protein